uniref:TBC1 domain family member 5 n=1 Tax=Talaromyces marneffei PM1 TaxID=1077442 RepID=A0A093UUC2_TALMA
MKTVEEARRRWETLLGYGRNTHDLKQAVISGDSENPCENGLRSVCWKIFLLCDDLDRSKWIDRLTDTRSAYDSLKDHFLKYIKHPNDLQSTVDPLAEDEESPWQALRHDEATRAEIFQDVERCLQDNCFFREPSTKSMMLDILFVYSKLNPDLGYRQGMHELLAPILWVVERDAVTQSSKHIPVDTTDDESVMLQLLDANYIESDSFNLFCSVMQVARSFYEHTDNRPVNGEAEMAPIVARSEFIHNELLMVADHELAIHLNTIEILPQIFLTRWIRLLFGREFSFDDTLLIWDLLFANGLRATLIDHICVAMLLRIRWQLLEVDYSSALTLLLRYPALNDHGPQTLVHDGLYLSRI